MLLGEWQIFNKVGLKHLISLIRLRHLISWKQKEGGGEHIWRNTRYNKIDAWGSSASNECSSWGYHKSTNWGIYNNISNLGWTNWATYGWHSDLNNKLLLLYNKDFEDEIYVEDYDVDVRNIDNGVVDIRNNVVDKCCKQSKT